LFSPIPFAAKSQQNAPTTTFIRNVISEYFLKKENITMDNLTTEDRRKNMKAIKSVSQLEQLVSKELYRRGLRYRRNVRSLKGSPDFAIKKYKIVIFIDSCFWHQCPDHGNMPKTNREFWNKKLNRNMERDQEVNDYYFEKGWYLLRLWEHEFKQDFAGAVDEIENFILHHKNNISNE
jgi:DNA mismatch endonuclease, patch repair protein